MITFSSSSDSDDSGVDNLEDENYWGDMTETRQRFYPRDLREEPREEAQQGVDNQQGEEQRRCKVELVEAKQSSQVESDYLLINYIKRFPIMKQALENNTSFSGGISVLFARDIPKKNDKRRRVDYKKQYLVGALRNFYKYACEVNQRVPLDEVVQCGKPSPIHFDIEMKCVKETLGSGEKMVSVLKLLCDAFLPDSTIDCETLVRLKDRYIEVLAMVFTKDVCRAGLAVIKASVNGVLSNIQDIDDEHLGMSVLSGCRADKFSLHIVMDSIYCESSVLSMPLVVFEIVRGLLASNVEWLVSNETDWVTNEGLFRIHALMINHLGNWVNTDDGEKFAFAGYNDTIFDEAIYSKNHLPRAPGACKVFNLVGGLWPILGDDDYLMESEFSFRALFDTHTNGFDCWRKHLIQNGLECGRAHVIGGLQPTNAYPAKHKFYLNQVHSVPIVRHDLCSHFERVHEFCNAPTKYCFL